MFMLKDLFSSKKFLVMLTAIVVYITGRFGLDLSPDAADKLLALVAVWLGAQGVADLGKEKAKIENATTTTTTATPAGEKTVVKMNPGTVTTPAVVDVPVVR